MNINISDADKDGKRKLTVTDGETEIYSGTADDTAHAHKIAAAGRKHGWDSEEIKGVAGAAQPTSKAKAPKGK